MPILNEIITLMIPREVQKKNIEKFKTVNTGDSNVSSEYPVISSQSLHGLPEQKPILSSDTVLSMTLLNINGLNKRIFYLKYMCVSIYAYTHSL